MERGFFVVLMSFFLQILGKGKEHLLAKLDKLVVVDSRQAQVKLYTRQMLPTQLVLTINIMLNHELLVQLQTLPQQVVVLKSLILESMLGKSRFCFYPPGIRLKLNVQSCVRAVCGSFPKYYCCRNSKAFSGGKHLRIQR